MSDKLAADPRIDPRIKHAFRHISLAGGDPVADREALVERANSAKANAIRAQLEAWLGSMDSEEVASSAGLRCNEIEISSAPDGNTIKLLSIRPDDDRVLPCVYYIHGGGMAFWSCFYGNYRAFARMIAHNDVAVVMVEFRNAVVPGAVPETAPYPAGLNDCVSGLRWLSENATSLGVDAGRIVVAGDSGGGNLTLATGMRLIRDGDVGLIHGVYALCPYIAGSWPRDDCPSSPR